MAVEVIEGSNRFSGWTVNVSRHGLFVAVDAPLKERFLVQFVLQLPDGPLPATGFVARVQEASAVGGVGVQFFALSAASKNRWDHFVHTLSGAGGPEPHLSTESPEQAAFLVKLKDRERLWEFFQRNYKRGGLYMATPVIKEEGAGIALVVVHPDSEAEFVITGHVARVCREAPKGMEIRFPPPDESAQLIFRDFIKTGEAPAEEPGPVPLPEPSADLSIDIEVDPSALEESARFSWDDVSDFRMIVDFELSSQETLDLTPQRPAERAGTTVEVPGPRAARWDAQATSEYPIPPELLARAKPTDELPAPPSEPATGGTADVPLLPGPYLPEAPPSARNRWSWPTPPEGVMPLGPSAVPAAPATPPPRFPPPRRSTPPAGSSVPFASQTPVPEILDLDGPGLQPPSAQASDDVEISFLDPIDVEEELPMVPPESELSSSWDVGPEEAAAAVEEGLRFAVPVEPSAEAPDQTGDLPRVEPSAEAPDQTGDLPRVEASPDEATPEQDAPPARSPYLLPAGAGGTRRREVGAEGATAVVIELPTAASAVYTSTVREVFGLLRNVEARCASCDRDVGRFELGPASGALGLVAEWRPYWNPDLQRFVTVLRLRSADDRQRALATVTEASAKVPVELVFAVADLNRPPVDPRTGTRVRVTGAVKGLLRVQDELTTEFMDLPQGRCPSCSEGRLQARRVED